MNSAYAVSSNFGNDDGLDLADASLGRRASSARYVWDDCTLAAEVNRARSLLKNRPRRDNPLLPRHLHVDRARRLDRNHLLSGTLDQPVTVRPWEFEMPASWWPLGLVTMAVAGMAFWFAGTPSTSRVGALLPTGQLGVPLMLLGLFALVTGMMLQLKSMRRESQAALDRMRLVELRLQEYRQAALLVGSDHKFGDGTAGFAQSNR